MENETRKKICAFIPPTEDDSCLQSKQLGGFSAHCIDKHRGFHHYNSDGELSDSLANRELGSNVTCEQPPHGLEALPSDWKALLFQAL